MTELMQGDITVQGRQRVFYWRDIRSDRAVIQQNFIDREYATDMFTRDADITARYRSILDAGLTPVIVDCGANIGTSVLHFLEAYPRAHVVAIEPAPDNFALLSRNTEGLNVTLINKGVCIIELHDWLYPGEGTSGPFLRLCGQRDRDFIYRGENIFSVSNRREW
ncbi:FkbM family methyltransferase [Salmonella enterica]|nr:FkbM family methyltransferase [Salmonella enterica]